MLPSSTHLPCLFPSKLITVLLTDLLPSSFGRPILFILIEFSFVFEMYRLLINFYQTGGYFIVIYFRVIHWIIHNSQWPYHATCQVTEQCLPHLLQLDCNSGYSGYFSPFHLFFSICLPPSSNRMIKVLHLSLTSGLTVANNFIVCRHGRRCRRRLYMLESRGLRSSITWLGFQMVVKMR